MKRDIVIVAPFADLPNETGNCRYFYLSDRIKENGDDVELIISSFSHLKKADRDMNIQIGKAYKLTFIQELGYKKNISLKRFYSHYLMGKNLKKYLNQRKKPDVILCAIPSLDVGKVVAKYCRDNGIDFIIDVQDLWPEAFHMIFNVPIISPLFFSPFTFGANYIYRQADEIVAVSQTYANRAKKVNDKVLKTHSVFLGTNLKDFDNIVRSSTLDKQSNKFLIAYVGTLGHSYNIKCIIEAVSRLNIAHKDIYFIVMGDGPLMNEFQKYAMSLNSQTHFMGRLEYKKMVEILSICDITVNPIAHNAAQSIINKVGDYAAAGLPVISTQECQEYRDIVNQYQIGYNCENTDIDDITSKILTLYENIELRIKMGKNNRLLAEEKFDRERSYKEIIDLLVKK